ncbi:aminotransferase class III-fold pyridoxal phosphate-dependent enzyme [Ancylobacter dichloromethanicus]|uniref:Aspartate aminotransferase family protein n=1 Tax=Ancylobacter dichloromethanicus TaxID=518825 RepID=A0A9W6J6S9_9HYPH|nr:transaminase [Ancylobacter dichloromethanicus]MBS7553051.1 aminotransferase class III-fold pyridoxal phosphate-dependent enzyme [Ancylobacter dichloromethanicus]GLK70373.1 aspartate aminotransferase family protein [Ancylobacter dichloromethanicus]
MNAVTSIPDGPGVSPARTAALRAEAEALYLGTRPRTRAAAGAAAHLLDGVPMHWMVDWSTPVPLVIAEASGARLIDVDGHAYDDFCLGDTASLFGHGPAPVAEALARQATAGLATMLPSPDAGIVGDLLSARFGLPYWQIATTATDANRFALRAARAATGRPRILIFDGAYHGAVDETFVEIGPDGRVGNRPALIGEPRDLSQLTRVVPFNDLDALEVALADRTVACVIAEPVMTNCAMVLPQPGFHEGLRDITRRHGTLLLIDETHTLSTGPGGYTRTHGLQPDMLVAGKSVAGGVPAAVWGMSEEVAERFRAARTNRPDGHSGMGTTLSGSPLQLAALRATLEHVATEAAYKRMNALADRMEAGLAGVLADARLPWHVARCGARVEVVRAPFPLTDGRQAKGAHYPALEATTHLALLVRGVLISPFHDMMLASPATSEAQVERLIEANRQVIGRLTG